ncbi:ATP phosphoribosyltransferase regulatory subunit [Plectonema cf. radiosum LEGE 06105]|uniref:ATP phosphoribosyltransferase regulatory subunit n=1 Tax=Plectonema cf. radiosum LEGE 06105 TaxID=945769 RepID=A0A8J7F1Z0_9CYAN|nr:ATP phosphoribosyltransferase regulatory subunit [Plectonema radiosum]MBE9211460.1 ATP phosphoribosyltransferase regulatory subunit [Plectonema cf. radiosum LEGE 06105]
MVYQPPAGARDLLPIDVVQKRWIEDRLEQVFHGWGYHRIITSTLERMDTLMAGGAIERSTVIQLQNIQEDELGLRPELTASIARTAVTRMADVHYPQRLYYNANVFGRTPEFKHNRQQEFYQAGVELLGGGGLVADAEVLLLVAACLQALNLQNWHLIVGEAGITQSLLKAFPANLKNQIRTAIANLDRVAIDTLSLSDELRDRAKIILDLRGKSADVLQKIHTLNLDEHQQQAVNNLSALVELIEAGGNCSLILDLSLIKTFDYYTGIIFEVVSNIDNQTRVIGSGGRYDQLLGLYHPQAKNIPGTGFALFIEDLYHVLLNSGQLPQTTPASNWLVVAENNSAIATAFAYAEKLRSSTHLVRVEMELGSSNASSIQEYARNKGIPQIAWIKADGSKTIESVNG